MSKRKPKRVHRLRGSRTYGWGSHKKHRGHGNKGGSGMGGTGKRADAKKPSVWNIPDYFGKIGFKKKGMVIKYTPINLSQVDLYIDTWVKQGKAKAGNGVYTIDLNTIGYNKLLGSGQIRKKIMITVTYASPSAVSKVEGLIAEKKKAEKKTE